MPRRKAVNPQPLKHESEEGAVKGSVDAAERAKQRTKHTESVDVVEVKETEDLIEHTLPESDKTNQDDETEKVIESSSAEKTVNQGQTDMADNEQDGGNMDGKRNRSLEALFQVTHSELQNFSRQHTPPEAESGSTPEENTDVPMATEEGTEKTDLPDEDQGISLTMAVQDAEQQPESKEASEAVIDLEQVESSESQQRAVRLPVSEKGVEKYQLKSSALEEQGFKLTFTKQPFDQYEPNPISYGSYRPRSFKPQTSPVASSESTSAAVTAAPATTTTTPADTSPLLATQVKASTGDPVVSVGRKRKHPSKPGRHICPYCGRGCAKPSVLQKHIRAHTGERPYPCIPCGFSFKTKSNLYKHCKSRAHAIKAGLTPNLDDAQKVDQEINEEDDIIESEGSDMESDTELQEGDLSIETGEAEQRRKKMRKGRESLDSIKRDKKGNERRKSTEVQSLGPREIRPKEVPSPQIQHMEGKTVIHFTLPEGHKLVLNEAQDVILGTMSPDGRIQQDVFGQIGQPQVLQKVNELDKQNVSPTSLQQMHSGGGGKVFMTDRQYYDVAFVGEEKQASDSSIHINIGSDDSEPLRLQQEQTSEDASGEEGMQTVAENPNDTIQKTHESVLSPDAVSILTQINPLGHSSAKYLVPSVGDPGILTAKVISGSNVSHGGPTKLKLHIPTKSTPTILRKNSASSSTPLSSSFTPLGVPPITSALPADRNAVTPEMLERRISQLISANAAILDTPMADAPRPKRLSRQNSEMSRSESGIAKATKQVEAPGTPTAIVSNISGFTAPMTLRLMNISEAQEQTKLKLVDPNKINQQHFLGVAEPPDKPPGIPSPNQIQQSLMKVSNLAKLTPAAEVVTSDATSGKPSDGSIDPNMLSSAITEVTSTPQEIKIQIKLPKPTSVNSGNPVTPVSQSGIHLLPVVSQIPSPQISSPQPTLHKAVKNPQNPEGSVIKDLLLKGRKKTAPTLDTAILHGMVAVEKDSGLMKSMTSAETSTLNKCSSEEGLFECLACNMSFDKQENLDIHHSGYCTSKESSTHLPENDDDEVFIPAFAGKRDSSESHHIPGDTVELESVDLSVPHEIGDERVQVEYVEKDKSQSPKNWVVGPHGDVVPLQVADNIEIITVPPALIADSKWVSGDNVNVESSISQKETLVTNVIEPVIPRKKGRPKGSKNKPKDLHLTQTLSPAVRHSVPGLKSPHDFDGRVSASPYSAELNRPLILSHIRQSTASIMTTQMLSPSLISGPIMHVPHIQPPFIFHPKGSVQQLDLQKASTGSIVSCQSPILATSSSALLPASISDTAVTPSTPISAPQEKSEALWKLKLKGKLLMKRSMSVERSLSIEKEKQESSTQNQFQARKSAETPTGKTCYQSLSEALSGKPVISTRAGSEPLLLSSVNVKPGQPSSKSGENLTVKATSLESEVLPLKKRKLDACNDAMSGKVASLKKEHESKQNQPTLLNAQFAQLNLLFDGKFAHTSQPLVNQIAAVPHNSVPIFSPHIPQNSQMLRLPLLFDLQCKQIGNSSSDDQDENDSHNNKSQNSTTSESSLENIFAKQSEVDLIGIKTTFEKYPVDVLLQGHEQLCICNRVHSTFCCISRPQPMYVQQGTNRKISMYSNWRVAPHTPGPLGLSTKTQLSLYNHNKKLNVNPLYSVATNTISKKGIPTHSSYWNHHKKQKVQELPGKNEGQGTVTLLANVISDASEKEGTEAAEHQLKPLDKDASQIAVAQVGAEVDVTETHMKDSQPVSSLTKQGLPKRVKIFAGGYKSNEDYTYVRGRGRGKYICEECGIRCKKPSMLKKHIRTHTDLRPYQCKFCHFSFKTKGNLTKHMKSKAHFKKCMELGINPIPITVDDSQIDIDALARQTLLSKEGAIRGDDEEFEEHQFSDEEEENMEEDEDEDEEAEDASIVVINESDNEYSDTARTSQSEVTEKEGGAGPTYIAIQHPDSSQPTIARISSDGKFVIEDSSTHRLSTVYGIRGSDLQAVMAEQINKDGSITGRPAVDDEVAHSLLDLSKNVDAANFAEEDVSGESDTQKAQRLQSLIGALMHRTKSGDGEQVDVKVHVVSSELTRPDKPNTVSDTETPNVQSLEKTDVEEDEDEVWVVMSDSGPVIVKQSQAKSPEEYHMLSPHASQTVPISSFPTSTPRRGSASTYAEKIAALQSANESDLKMMINRPALTATGFVPPFFMNTNMLQAGSKAECVSVNVTAPRSSASVHFTDSSNQSKDDLKNAEKTSGVIRTPSSLPVSQPPLMVSTTTLRETSVTRDAGDESSPWKEKQTSCDEDSLSTVVTERGITGQKMAGLNSGESRQRVRSSSSSEGIALERSPTSLTPPHSQAGTTQERRTASALSPGGSRVQYVTSENRAPFEIMPIPGRVNDSSDSLVDGKYVCNVCQKSFSKHPQLVLHKNIHYFERPFKCEDCGISFRIKCQLLKHQRSESHMAKQSINIQFGTPTTDNPRPYKCEDCNIAFRIHGHLAKHLRSKAHITTLEKLCKLPPGTYAQIEKNDLTDIDATDCETSLESIQNMIEQDSAAGHGNSQKDKNESESIRSVTPKPADSSSSVEILENLPSNESTNKKSSDSGSPQFRMNNFGGEYERDARASNERVTVEIKSEFIEFGQIKPQSRYGGDGYSSVETEELSDGEGFVSEKSTIPTEETGHTSQVYEKSTSEENAPHKCGICRKNFKSVTILKQHLVSHAELRPYVCEYCDAGFTTAKSLKFHLRTHTEAHPYICGHCGDNFARSEMLRHHMRTHSRGRQTPCSDYSDLEASDSEAEFHPSAKKMGSSGNEKTVWKQNTTENVSKIIMVSESQPSTGSAVSTSEADKLQETSTNRNKERNSASSTNDTNSDRGQELHQQGQAKSVSETSSEIALPDREQQLSCDVDNAESQSHMVVVKDKTSTVETEIPVTVSLEKDQSSGEFTFICDEEVSSLEQPRPAVTSHRKQRECFSISPMDSEDLLISQSQTFSEGLCVNTEQIQGSTDVQTVSKTIVTSPAGLNENFEPLDDLDDEKTHCDANSDHGISSDKSEAEKGKEEEYVPLMDNSTETSASSECLEEK